MTCSDPQFNAINVLRFLLHFHACAIFLFGVAFYQKHKNLQKF